MSYFQRNLMAAVPPDDGISMEVPAQTSKLSADYVIIGAGSAGLLVANRLSANPDIKVVVIEAGLDDRSNPNVTNPLNRYKNANTSIDWAYKSIPQKRLNNRSVQFTAGKIVGGTSMINGMNYIRTAIAEIDGWEKLGAKGWNWNTLFPYYKAVERFTDPTAKQMQVGAGVVPSYHGRNGELPVGFPEQLLTTNFSPSLASAWKTLGVSSCEDPNGGKVEGYTVRPLTIDRSGLRASAATAFYYPIANRSNLRVLQGSALKLLWSKHDQNEKPTANGVQYLDEKSSVQSIMVNQPGEVIIAAGALATPIVLEASGVGSGSLLKKLGIETVVDLPGVGENFQDQPKFTAVYTPKTATPGVFTPFAAFVTAQDVFGNKTEEIAISTEKKLRHWAETVAFVGKHASPEAIEVILRHQHDLIFKKKVAIGEITMTSSDQLASEYWSLLPFSRGSVHLRTPNIIESQKANIDLRLFQIHYDQECFLALSRLTLKFWATDPAAKLVTSRIRPELDQIPADATEKQWMTFIRQNTRTNNHALGSAAMMSRDLGGVVDHELRVYGTANVRVVDASVIPLQVTGHLISTIYAVAARAADLIIASHSKPRSGYTAVLKE